MDQYRRIEKGQKYVYCIDTFFHGHSRVLNLLVVRKRFHTFQCEISTE